MREKEQEKDIQRKENKRERENRREKLIMKEELGRDRGGHRDVCF